VIAETVAIERATPAVCKLIATFDIACALLTDLPVDDKAIETFVIACAVLTDLPVAVDVTDVIT